MKSSATLLALLLGIACAPSYKQGRHDIYFQRSEAPTLHPPISAAASPSDWWDEVLHSVVVPIATIASPATYVGLALGGPRALDVNEFGQVPDSEWFENRINRGVISTEAIAAGPGQARGPAPGPLTVMSGKLAGVSPGFVVRDSLGVIFFVKFDPPAFPRLASGAEMVASRLLWAAGYHVPDNFIVDLDLARLRLDPNAKTRDDYKRTVALTEAALIELTRQLNPDPRGHLRALFSRSVPGTPLGPFRFRGVRGEDPNDTIAHERRRSLRGLWVFSAWLNNIDTRAHNTMDTFIAEPSSRGLGFVRHYLIDFGASLGSASIEEKHVAQGYEARVEWPAVARRFISLGFHDPLWFLVERSPFREVGIFEAKVFDPATWAPTYTNPAFRAADADDTFWAASILAHFTRADIAAAVSAAEYRDPGAARYITTNLERRRNKILRHAFTRRAPLDLPRVTSGELRLTDLIVLAELAETPASYQFSVRWHRTRRADQAFGVYRVGTPALPLGPVIERARTEHPQFAADPYLRIGVRRIVNGEPSPVLDVLVRVVGDTAMTIALRH